LFDRATLADPEIEMTSRYGAGGFQARGWYKMTRGKWTLQASFSDIVMLSAYPMSLQFGTMTPFAGGYTFTEAGRIPSMTMYSEFFDISGSSLLIRRYTGGKTGRFTLTCEENEPAKYSLEDLTFLDIAHNIAGIPKYDAGVISQSIVYPGMEPFYFHGGLLSLNNHTFGRVRSITIEANNNVEGRYYWKVGSPFMPSEIVEGRREYLITCKIDIEDNLLFQELVNCGVYSNTFQGFSLDFKMTRTAGTDYVETVFPASTPSASNHGCFIRRCKTDITSDPLVTAELEIVARNPACTVCTPETYTTP
jgi:hypothetical protein